MIYKIYDIKSLLKGKSILIAGYGREGRSTYKLIRKILPDTHLAIADSNPRLVNEPIVETDNHLDLYYGENYLNCADRFDLIFKAPGIPTFDFEGKCDLDKITSQTDIFLQIYGKQVIGITGTKGKSTTTNLIASILKQQYPDVVMAGNMGIPLFDVLDKVKEDTVVVCEFSCHQLESIHRAPHVSVLLNLFQEHLDHYHSYEDYKMAKMNIGLFQQEGDFFFYSSDNQELVDLVNAQKTSFKGKTFAYSLSDAEKSLVKDTPSNLLGTHNVSNIQVAYEVSKVMGVSDQNFQKAVSQFNGLEHRLEYVGEYQGIRFYNDSISTIPAATIEAIKAIGEGNVATLIVGGFDRNIDYRMLVDFLKSHPVNNLICVGRAGERIRGMLGECCRINNIISEDDYAKIVDSCYRLTPPGKVCLLSPAAASYDAFKNFEERGHIFKYLVQQHNK